MAERLSPDALIARLKSLKLLSLDVDGVLTDGGLYFAEDGSQLRKFNVKDGMGIKMVQQTDVDIAIISKSTTVAIHHRAEVLGITHVYLGVDDKLATLNALCADNGWALTDVAHIGDDVNDLVLLREIGLPLTVADAVDSVLDEAVYVTKRNGGEGAVREICDLILKAKA